MPKLNTTTSGIITATLTADSSPTLDLQENGVTFRTLGQSQLVSGIALTASGTSVDFSGIPSWAKRVTVMFSGVSTNGTSSVQVQLGDSGGVETTGYAYAGNRVGGAGDSTGSGSASAAGFVFVDPGSAASIRTGLFVVANFSGNTWAAYGGYGFTQGVSLTTIGGTKTLSDTLDRVRITTVNGTDAFDAGTINIMWE